MEKAIEKSGRLKVEDFVVGLGLVGVKLSDGSAGVAYNMREGLLGQCEEFSEEGENYRLILEPGMKAKDFIKAFESTNAVARALALATMNAVLNRGEYDEGDLLEYLEIKPGERVGMIGEIGPFITKLIENGNDVLVFERNPKRGMLPDWAIMTHLESCDVVIITAATIVNWTIEWILDYVNTDRVAIVGPSAPMVEGIFPVKVIGGAVILDPDRMLKEFSHAYGTHGVYKTKIGKKVNLVLRR
jgi:uncharacterized protein (DUF4213/DUF364 family)